MRHRILHLMCLVMCVVVLMTAAYAQQAQQSHWATPDDKTAKFMIDMERKWGGGPFYISRSLRNLEWGF